MRDESAAAAALAADVEMACEDARDHLRGLGRAFLRGEVALKAL